jgi:hypothetical protein
MKVKLELTEFIGSLKVQTVLACLIGASVFSYLTFNKTNGEGSMVRSVLMIPATFLFYCMLFCTFYYVRYEALRLFAHFRLKTKHK